MTYRTNRNVAMTADQRPSLQVGGQSGSAVNPHLGDVPAIWYDPEIHNGGEDYGIRPDDVSLTLYRPPGDGLAIYVRPTNQTASAFRLFIEPKDCLRLAVTLIRAAICWRNWREWDADMTPAERREMENCAL